MSEIVIVKLKWPAYVVQQKCVNWTIKLALLYDQEYL